MSGIMRYVCKHKGDWAVWKEGSKKPSVLFENRIDAERRAIEIVGNAGGGKVEIRVDEGVTYTVTVPESYTYAFSRDYQPGQLSARMIK
ncbi:MAG: DUF2188 domain-containing protein [Gammaproteobacteria bacterium]|nr:DUF2188 domain-containing protein [Gammaproteobacteria bacterium]